MNNKEDWTKTELAASIEFNKYLLASGYNSSVTITSETLKVFCVAETLH